MLTVQFDASNEILMSRIVDGADGTLGTLVRNAIPNDAAASSDSGIPTFLLIASAVLDD